jgi:2-polyprenyl-3-methyl-5-hydroxy-6-metoxy-1,4-benzoquinol methylase
MKDDLSHPCNICHATEFDVLSTRDRDGKYLRTVICKDCGLVWSDPFPLNPTEYYQKDYRILYKGTFEPKIKHIYRAAKNALTRYQGLKSFLHGKKEVLEIGSGGGEFAYLLTQLGFAVRGIEPNEGYGNYSKSEYGLDIQIGFAQNTEFVSESFDFITTSHVLEHVDDPTLVLKKLHDWLKNDGILAIEVPNIEATCQSPKSTFHTAHLFNFNAATLSLLAEKSGFTVVKTFFSRDKGNVSLIAQKNSQLTITPKLAIAGNCEKIQAIVEKHTPLTHYFSASPYLRLLNKIPRLLEEKSISKKFTVAKAVLDLCYKNIIKS